MKGLIMLASFVHFADGAVKLSQAGTEHLSLVQGWIKDTHLLPWERLMSGNFQCSGRTSALEGSPYSYEEVIVPTLLVPSLMTSLWLVLWLSLWSERVQVCWQRKKPLFLRGFQGIIVEEGIIVPILAGVSLMREFQPLVLGGQRNPASD